MTAVVVSKTINHILTIPAMLLASFPLRQRNREAADGRMLQITSGSSGETSWGTEVSVDALNLLIQIL